MLPPRRRSHFPSVLVPLMLAATGPLAGCGGGGDGPTGTTPPPGNTGPGPTTAVVTTVSVAPATVALSFPDSAQLTVTVRDQNGAVMTGKVPTFATASSAVATVSATGRVVAVGAGTTSITATVEGKSAVTAVTVTVPPALVPETARAASATVGIAGGTVTATSAAGVQYELVVPKMALDSSVRITVTPLTRINRLPFSGPLLGGVDFAPNGLRFNPGVTLRVRAPVPSLASGQGVIGFTFSGELDALRAQPARRDGDAYVIGIEHFSGGGVAVGTSDDLTRLPLLPQSSIAQQFSQQLAAALLAGDLAAARTVLTNWARAIEPTITAARTALEARRATDLFLYWIDGLSKAGFHRPLDAALTPVFNDSRAATQEALRQGIGNANARCLAERSLVQANNAMFLHSYAQALSFDLITPGSGLELNDVLAGLCVKAVNTRADFPDPAAPNSTHPLDLRFGVRFGTAPQLANAGFDVTLTTTGTRADGTRTFRTDTAGTAPTQPIDVGAVPLTLDARACIGQVAGVEVSWLETVCTTTRVTRAIGQRKITGTVVVNTQVGLAGLSDVFEITGDLIIGSAAVTSTDLRELSLLQRVGGTFNVTGVPTLTSFAGMTALQSVGKLRLQDLPLITNLARFSAIQLSGLALVNLPGIVSLFELPDFAATLNGDFVIQELPNLRDLFPMRTVSHVTGSVAINGSAAPAGSPITTLSHLAALRRVDGNLALSHAALTSVSGLAGLQIVGSVLGIGVNHLDGLNDLTLPALTRVGSLSVARSAGRTPTAAGPLNVSLPALTQINSGDFGGQPPLPGRQFTISLPVLSAIATTPAVPAGRVLIINQQGLIGLTLGPIGSGSTVNSLFIADNPDLRTLTFAGPFRVANDVHIDANAALQSVTGTGTTNSLLIFTPSATWGIAAAEAWAMSVNAVNRRVNGRNLPTSALRRSPPP